MTKSWHQNFRRAPKADRTYKNIVFDSKKELHKYQELELLQRAGVIKNLKIQVQHELILPNGVPIRTRTGRVSYYTSDYEYFDCETGEDVIADCKGYRDEHSAFRIAVFEAVSGKTVKIL